jgi:hypothetical protein
MQRKRFNSIPRVLGFFLTALLKYLVSPSHPIQNDCHQEFKKQQMLLRIQGVDESLYILGGECKLVQPL